MALRNPPPSYGHILPGPADGSAGHPHHRRCSGSGLWLARGYGVPDDLWRFDVVAHHDCGPGDFAPAESARLACIDVPFAAYQDPQSRLSCSCETSGVFHGGAARGRADRHNQAATRGPVASVRAPVAPGHLHWGILDLDRRVVGLQHEPQHPGHILPTALLFRDHRGWPAVHPALAGLLLRVASGRALDRLHHGARGRQGWAQQHSTRAR